jgi:hypothetical protein
MHEHHEQEMTPSALSYQLRDTIRLGGTQRPGMKGKARRYFRSSGFDLRASC